MKKSFNVNGVCRPYRDYMANPTSRLEAIKDLIAHGDYFMIIGGRQCGKTTLLRSLAVYLENEYDVVLLDFQRLSSQTCDSESSFVEAFARMLLTRAGNLSENIREQFTQLRDRVQNSRNLQVLFDLLSYWCLESKRPIVLLIDEVDTAVNNRVFADFLAQLRAACIDSDITPAFKSVILAGAQDMRIIKGKLRPEEEHRRSSFWTIAARFTVDLNFRTNEIADMLREYEIDHQTGMNVPMIAWLLYDYTSGHPMLVSNLCKIIDEVLSYSPEFPEQGDAWTQKGVEAAVKILLKEQNPLFTSIWEDLNCHPQMKNRIYTILFRQHSIPYNVDDPVTAQLSAAGLVKNVDGSMRIPNRIFETRLHNGFLMAAEIKNIEKSPQTIAE